MRDSTRPKTSTKPRRTLSIVDRSDVNVNNLFDSKNTMKSEYTSNFTRKSSNSGARPFSAVNRGGSGIRYGDGNQVGGNSSINSKFQSGFTNRIKIKTQLTEPDSFNDLIENKYSSDFVDQ
jgi:hypothetical protein